MPGQRGILGVPYPKNNILFSFNVKKGEEWASDDSDDSDYAPTAEDAAVAGIKLERKRKRCKKDKVKNSEEKPCKSQKRGHEGQESTSGQMWGETIPPEILLKIFHFVVMKQGAVPSLCKISRVCRHWYRTSCHPSLWHHVDLSYGWVKSEDKTLQWLCENRLSRVCDINLNGWKNLTNTGVEAIAAHCPMLKTINIAYCSKITSQGLRSLIDNCHSLANVDLSFMHADTVAPQSIKHLVESCGSNLRQLNLSGNKLKGFNTILTAITLHCPNLDTLEICNAFFSTDFVMLNIEKLQAALPHLRILRLANSKFRAPPASARLQSESPGFPELEELSIAINPEDINTHVGINDSFLFRLLKASRKLRLLDLRGSSHLTIHGLQVLPVENLEHLYLSQSSVAKYDGIEVIVQKWQHSLLELDLAWNVYPGMSLDLAMRKLADAPNVSCLEILNLSGTCISCSRVKSLLEGCPNLKTLNLASCRGLSRGMKREYTGRDLNQLRRDIDGIVEAQTADG